MFFVRSGLSLIGSSSSAFHLSSVEWFRDNRFHLWWTLDDKSGVLIPGALQQCFPFSPYVAFCISVHHNIAL